MFYDVVIDGTTYSLELKQGGSNGEWLCSVRSSKSGKPSEFHFDATLTADDVLSLLLAGKSYSFKRDASSSALVLNGRRFEVEVRDPRSLRSRRAAAGVEDGPRKLTAPMPGKVVRVIVPAGQTVEAGQGVLVVEAMKMQNELKSPKAGKVQKILVSEGSAVNAGDVLAIVE